MELDVVQGSPVQDKMVFSSTLLPGLHLNAGHIFFYSNILPLALFVEPGFFISLSVKSHG